MKRIRFLIIFLALLLPLFHNSSVWAVGSQINVNVVNNYSPTVDPTYQDTGTITWLSEQTVVKGDLDDDLSFLVDYNPADFQYLMIDSTYLVEDTDFEIQEEPQGTVFVIYNSTLSNLNNINEGYGSIGGNVNYGSVGENEELTNILSEIHTLTAVFAGNSYSTNFTLTTVVNNDDDEGGESEGEVVPVPNTGENTDEGIGLSVSTILPIVATIMLIALMICGWKIYKKHFAWRPKKFAIRRSKWIPVTVIGAFVLCGVGIKFAAMSTTQEETDVSAIDVSGGSLQLAVSSENINLSANVTNGAVMTADSQTVSVTNSTNYGYRLYLSMDNTTKNSLYPNNESSSNEKITAVRGTKFSPVILSNNTWGYAVGGADNFDSAYSNTPAEDSKWAAVPLKNSEVLIKSVNSATTANDSTTVYYGAKVSQSLPTNTYSGNIVYTAIANDVPSETYALYFNANGGSNEPDDLSYTGTETSYDFTIPSTTPARDDYNFLGWATSKTAVTAEYVAGDTITLTSNSSTQTLYAVWEEVTPTPTPTPVTTYTYALSFNANGGSGAPSKMTNTNTETSYIFTIPNTAPIRSGYNFLGWAISKTATAATYVAGNTVTLTSDSPTQTLYAVWEVASTDVKISNIAISGANTISMNNSSPTSQLTATVTPSNATNKDLTWSSDNTSVAKVNDNGLVTGVDAGVANITATAADDSGVSTTYTVSVNKKIIIIIGASQVNRFTNNYYNFTSYTNSTTGNVFKTDGDAWYGAGYSNGKTKGTLNYVAESGTSFAYQIEGGDGWKKALNLIKKYSDRKDYAEFHVYFPIAGNGIKGMTCSEISSSSSKIQSYAEKYNSTINTMVSSGYNIKGHVVSVQPVRPSESSNSYVVSDSSSNKCKSGYRSNYKYNDFNKAMGSIISAAGYANLDYVNLFSDIMNFSDSKYTFKSSWSEYSTTDGVHWNKTTAKKYLNAMLNKNTSL